MIAAAVILSVNVSPVHRIRLHAVSIQRGGSPPFIVRLFFCSFIDALILVGGKWCAYDMILILSIFRWKKILF